MQQVPVKGYELFSIYGFNIEYPDTWEVELNPKSERTAGDVVFKALHHRVFLSWGNLNSAKEKYGSLDKHVDAGIQKVKKGGDVRKLETLERRSISINGHEAIFSRYRVTLGVSFYAMRTAYREVSSVHAHCEQTGKFFVLYESVMGSSALTDSETIFEHMKMTFRCH